MPGPQLALPQSGAAIRVSRCAGFRFPAGRGSSHGFEDRKAAMSGAPRLAPMATGGTAAMLSLSSRLDLHGRVAMKPALPWEPHSTTDE
jgi:hypothetical protein